MKIYKNSNVKELTPSDFILKNLNGNVKCKNTPSLIIFYADWCPHCKNPQLINNMNFLGKVLPKRGINVNAYNCAFDEEHEEMAQQLNIKGFPTIIYFNQKGKRNEYNGPRDIKNILDFMIQKS